MTESAVEATAARTGIDCGTTRRAITLSRTASAY